MTASSPLSQVALISCWKPSTDARDASKASMKAPLPSVGSWLPNCSRTSSVTSADSFATSAASSAAVTSRERSMVLGWVVMELLLRVLGWVDAEVAPVPDTALAIGSDQDLHRPGRAQQLERARGLLDG